MKLTWQNAVKSGLERYSVRNLTVKIERSKFLQQELERIIFETGSYGKTPAQTVSRILQELRDDKYLFFSSSTGSYILNKEKINALNEDLSDDILENAIEEGLLELPDTQTSSDIAVGRIRRGMNALRKKTLLNYRHSCALCDINDSRLLVTSHIARWADNVKARGLLSNTICFCTLHDKLFENGYFSMNTDLELIWKMPQNIKAIDIWRQQCTVNFKTPQIIKPAQEFINQHRSRVGL